MPVRHIRVYFYGKEFLKWTIIVSSACLQGNSKEIMVTLERCTIWKGVGKLVGADILVNADLFDDKNVDY